METGLPPVYDEKSRIMILGSFPSVRSRAEGFYYGHPQNRFWKVLAAVLGESVPTDIPGKRALLLRNGIALWDAAETCEIKGSSDASMRSVVPNDAAALAAKLGITRIFANGKTAAALCKKYIIPGTSLELTVLPSTSPANASWSLERLCEAWRVITE